MRSRYPVRQVCILLTLMLSGFTLKLYIESHLPGICRLLGFLGMALLLWTPVLVPLLPTLLQQWATKSPNGVADAAAGIGLYGAVFILITIWGKRVRGYDRPLVSYGLELLSRAKVMPLT